MSTKNRNSPPRKSTFCPEKRHSKLYRKHLIDKETFTPTLQENVEKDLISERLEQNDFDMQNVDRFIGMDEIIIVLSNKSADALVILTNMLATFNFSCLDVLFLSEIRLFGNDIANLWEKYCGGNMQKFKETIHYFRMNNFSHQDVQKLVQPVYEHWIPEEFEQLTI